MIPKELSELSVEELKTKEKGLKVVVGIYIGILTFMSACSVYLTFQQGFNVFTILPVAFLPIFIGFLGNLKKVKNEIALRNS